MIRPGPWRINPDFPQLDHIDDPVILTGQYQHIDPMISVMLTLDEIVFLCDCINSHHFEKGEISNDE